MKKHKTFWEILKFIIVSLLVTIIQLALVNILFIVFKNYKAPLPSFLNKIFTESSIGKGNNNWGYVLPFLLSNLIANIYGYFQNRRTTFKSSSSHWNIIVYIIIIILLILFSTWLQGVVANACLGSGMSFFIKLAPTIAAMTAGSLQMIILFPLEKFVLFKKHKEENKEK